MRASETGGYLPSVLCLVGCSFEWYVGPWARCWGSYLVSGVGSFGGFGAPIEAEDGCLGYWRRETVFAAALAGLEAEEPMLLERNVGQLIEAEIEASWILRRTVATSDVTGRVGRRQ